MNARKNERQIINHSQMLEFKWRGCEQSLQHFGAQHCHLQVTLCVREEFSRVGRFCRNKKVVIFTKNAELWSGCWEVRCVQYFAMPVSFSAMTLIGLLCCLLLFYMMSAGCTGNDHARQTLSSIYRSFETVRLFLRIRSLFVQLWTFFERSR